MDGKLFGVGRSLRGKRRLSFFSFSLLMMGIFFGLVWFGVYMMGLCCWDVHKLPQPTSPTELVLGHVVLFGDSIIWC